jgi:hypothetical protein
VGGRPGDNIFAGALMTVKSLFHCLDVAWNGAVLFPGMDDKDAAAQNPEALKQAYEAGGKLAR